MQENKYLLYQPNHGLGMELHIFHTAARVAAALDRTLVVPRLPRLETNTYEAGLDEYFDISPAVHWVSHRRFLELSKGVVEHIIKVVPNYRPEYRSELNRSWHPVWLRNIMDYPYFEQVGCSTRRVTQIDLEHNLDLEEVRRLFASDGQALGITYMNGLLSDEAEFPVVPDDDFAGRHLTPTGPSRQYVAQVKSWSGGLPFQAVHIREGYRDLVMDVSGVRIPKTTEFIHHLGKEMPTYVATDVDSVFLDLKGTLAAAGRVGAAEPVAQAVTDMAFCIAADTFIGTHFSTFSQYISHVRKEQGKSDDTTVLLRESRHDADYKYNTYNAHGARGES